MVASDITAYLPMPRRSQSVFALYVARNLGLLHFAQRVVHLGGGFALRVLQIAHRGLMRAEMSCLH
jgi:hypothetical protein